MKKKNKVVTGRCRYWMAAVSAALCTTAMTSQAADAVWQGGASGSWGTAYTDNWSGYPSTANAAKFGEPKSDTITVHVDEAVDANGIVCDTGRTAGLNFTGGGTLTNHGGTLLEFRGSSIPVDWNINIVNKYNPTLVYGTNRFHKTFDSSSIYGCNIQSGAKVTLSDSAKMTGQHVKVLSGAVLDCQDSSVVSLTKDLAVSPGASLYVSPNAVLAPRGLSLPFSQTAGVSDGWALDGGMLCITNSGGFAAATSRSLNFPYTNATKTVSGTGTIQFYGMDSTSASNSTFRLNGPDMYIRSVVGNASMNNALEVTGGSTLGVWGANVTIDKFATKFTGTATLDTTDFANKTTPRTITLSKFGVCSGNLNVKGVGSLKLGVNMTQPNLNLTIEGGAKFNAQSQYLYALGDFVLKDSASFLSELYIGHKGETECVKSLTMSNNATLNVGRYVDVSGDVTLSGNASAVIRNYKKESSPLSCANLSLSGNASLTVLTGTVSCAAITLADSASLTVPGTISATSLAMSGDAHISFTAGTAFMSGAAFGDGNWTMDITIPANYEAGLRPIVTGAQFGEDFASHVTLAGETNGWTVGVVDGLPVLYKGAAASGIEWTGGSSTSDNWSDSANWNGGILPTATDLAAFGGIARLAPVNDSISTLSGLVFRASAGPFTLTGAGPADKLKLTADCHSRGTATEDRADIVSHSGFVQTLAVPIEFPRCAYVHSDGGAEVRLTHGFVQGTTTDSQYFIAGGEVAIGGNCVADKLGFRTAASGKPTTCLRLMQGCDFTLSNQGDNSFTEGANYIGRFIIEEGAQILMQGGECSFFYGALENVVNGTLKVEGNGRLISGPNEQYYSGSGTIYAARALACRDTSSKNRYINFGGSLKLYMNGDWNTASYLLDGTTLRQNPNCPTRFRMTDGTTLGATADWTYGPKEGAFSATNEIVTAAGRASVMTGTVTIDTQDPLDATKSHTITFVDPLDASAATIVKKGAGDLVFNTPAGFQLQFGSLTVNEGLVSFAAAPTFSGTLTLATGTQFRADALVGDLGWTVIATATSIVGPGGATEWATADGVYKFRIVTSGGTSRLECTRNTGVMVFFL